MKLKGLVLSALFCALLCIFAPFSISIGPISLSLATLAIYVFATLLPMHLSVPAVCAYVLLGAVGMPVFSGFSGGVGVLVGMSGGFILGYIPATALISYLSRRAHKPIAMICGTAVLYLIGTSYFAVYTDSSVWTSLLVCVVPFLLGDTIKIMIAYYISSQCQVQMKKLI